MMLRHQLGEWAAYDETLRENLNFIIVDDCSPDKPASHVVLEALKDTSDLMLRIDIEVYKVDIDRPWGQDAARNIAMHHCMTEWALMTDMDHVLPASQAQRMLTFVENKARAGTYYLPKRVKADGTQYHSHPNTFLFRKDDFWQMGGYDEDFVGYYGSDGNFRKCARGAGFSEQHVEDFGLILYGSDVIPDAHTRGLTRKDGPLWAAKNPFLNKKRTGPPYKASNPLRVPYRRVV
jgi:hypothetical protein